MERGITSDHISKCQHKNGKASHPYADLVTFRPPPVTPVKRKKIPPNWTAAMVSKQLTQTAGNRRGDPIRGAVKKEGIDWRQEKERKKKRKKTEVGPSVDPPPHKMSSRGYFSRLARQNDRQPILDRSVTCCCTVSQDRAIFNLFMTCQYQHQGRVIESQ